MTWNEEAYDHLVYSEEYKDLALAFVQNHQQLEKVSGDVIKAKGMVFSILVTPKRKRLTSNLCAGQGLIFLLSGPPGTGKTLTAEASKATMIVIIASAQIPMLKSNYSCGPD